MFPLRIPIASIPEEGYHVAVSVAVSEIQPPGAADVPCASVNVEGTVTPVGKEYVFHGHVRGVFRHACDRCLEPAVVPFDVEVYWDFEERVEVAALGVPVREDEEDDAGVHYFEGHEIDLAPWVWEEVALETPFRFLCSNSCKGLCPVCGGNRNITPCTCEAAEDAEQEEPTGLAKIKLLFPELNNGKE